MKIAGSAVVHADPARTWAAITDPTVLATVIPGCEALTPIEDNRFALTVTLGVASIKGSYSGEVSFADLVEPSALTMRANGSGAPGTIDTTVRVTLTVQPEGTTRVDYDADAVVGGMVGGVGQRVLAGVAKKTAGLFFAAVDDVLIGARPVAPTQALAEAAQVAVGGGPAALPAPAAVTVQAARRGGLSLIGAAAFGAISMLIGVLVGARISRKAR
jgi:carbon monoxide dehydrogenase subunit G